MQYNYKLQICLRFLNKTNMENQMLKFPSIHMHARTHTHSNARVCDADTSVGRGLLSSKNGGPWDKTS